MIFHAGCWFCRKINAKHCMRSHRRCVCNPFEERYVINPKEKYTCGDDMHIPRDYIRLTAITYQSFGLDKKRRSRCFVFFGTPCGNRLLPRTARLRSFAALKLPRSFIHYRSYYDSLNLQQIEKIPAKKMQISFSMAPPAGIEPTSNP